MLSIFPLFCNFINGKSYKIRDSLQNNLKFNNFPSKINLNDFLNEINTIFKNNSLAGRYRPDDFFNLDENLPKKPIEPSSIYVRCEGKSVNDDRLKFEYFDESINDGVFLAEKFPFSELQEGVNSQKTPLIAVQGNFQKKH